MMQMKSINRHKTVPYSPQQMFDLVNDVARYPEFVPYCRQTHIISQSTDSMEATLSFTKGILHQSFTTKNTLIPAERIALQLVNGPFQFLKGQWQFQSSDLGCDIAFDLSFSFKNPLLDLSLGAFFQQIATQLVDCFAERAKNVYG